MHVLCLQDEVVATVAFADRASLEVFVKLALQVLPDWLTIRQSKKGWATAARAPAGSSLCGMLQLLAVTDDSMCPLLHRRAGQEPAAGSRPLDP